MFKNRFGLIWHKATFICILALLTFIPNVHSQKITGQVADKISSPIPFPEICALVTPKFCVIGNDSGFFDFEIPTVIKNISQAKPWLKIHESSVIGYTPVPEKLVLDLFNVAGKKISSVRIDLRPSAFSITLSSIIPAASQNECLHVLRTKLGGLTQSTLITSFNSQMLRVPNQQIESMAARTLAKGTVELEITKQGYVKEQYRPYPNESSIWITMTLLSDTGYIKTNRNYSPTDAISGMNGEPIKARYRTLSSS